MDIPRITLKEFKRRFILSLRYNIIIDFSNAAMWFDSVFTHPHYIESIATMHYSICDCILENRPFCHISYFEKYKF